MVVAQLLRSEQLEEVALHVRLDEVQILQCTNLYTTVCNGLFYLDHELQ